MPVEDLGHADLSEYYQSHYSSIQHFPTIHSHCKKLKPNVMIFAERCDFNLIRFLSKHMSVGKNVKRSPSALGVVTLNTPDELSFSNDTHVNVGNMFLKQKRIDMLDNLALKVEA